MGIRFRSRQVDIIDNRALGIACYHPGYTLVEKLQTISTKFRKQRETGECPANFLRHYYDVYALLGNSEVLEFLGSASYFARTLVGEHAEWLRERVKSDKCTYEVWLPN
ncbi:nucleotidyl transferase AbiEii/AbiGii toxin family protein [Brucella sp. IR073]|uniref:nucleotidyl transferase AbiEii/AbiGii toxin family protein n=1 Tax=unclassified Brucella TaxID=2632610 RepID=UPI003B983D85